MPETEEQQTIKLLSMDGDTFELPLTAARLSKLVSDAVGEDDDVQEVEASRVRSTCLAKIIEFLNHHSEEPMTPIPTPLGGTSIEEIVEPQWYRKFLEEQPQETIFELVSAANYMTIQPLLDLTCLKITFEIVGKSAEDIRELLNLPEMTPEEEAKARQEFAFLFEGN